MNSIGFLFDLDGVLIDSEREYTRIWENIDKKYPTGVKNFALAIKGQTLSKILSDNYDDETRKSVTEELHRQEKMMRYEYCDGADMILDTLKELNGKTAVVTSSDEDKMNHLYSDLPAFRNRVRVVIDASRVSRSKPDPEGYQIAAQELKIDIRRCAVFEDSVQGVRAGKASGAYVIGITGTKSREELSPFSDTVVDSLNEIDIENLAELLRNR